MGVKKNNQFRLKLVLGILILMILILSGVYLFYSKQKYGVYNVKSIKELHVTKGIPYDEYTLEYAQIKKAFEILFFDGLLPVTNLQTFDVEDTASGDDVLSESLGLMMLIAIKENNEGGFDSLVSVLETTFVKENGLLKWRVQSLNDEAETVNASIDDFRVIKALYEAAEVWGNPAYKERALTIGDSLYLYCMRDNELTSYDEVDSPLALMTYYDFKAMLYLTVEDKKWETILLKGLNEVYRHKVVDRPFYEKQKVSESYRSIENLMILQHLYEVGLKDEQAIIFIKKQIEDSGYYAAYSAVGQVTDDIESPAIYGIIAQIAKLAEDESLYRMACEKIIQLSGGEQHLYPWAFVDENTHVGYSFDHLMALLGL